MVVLTLEFPSEKEFPRGFTPGSKPMAGGGGGGVVYTTIGGGGEGIALGPASSPSPLGHW